MNQIEVVDICKTYVLGETEVKALDHIHISIEKGEFISVMGPSGSGKSTFMNLIGCLDRADSGVYRLESIDVGALNRDRLAEIRNKKIGFVFQGFNLLARSSAVENVELPMLYNGVPAAERREKAVRALQRVGLGGREQHRPNQLSGGQQQRVAIARALVNEAPILLADEPTGNLDTKTSNEIMDLLVRLNNDSRITIVLVTHEPDIARYSRRVVRFLDGRIVDDSQVKNRTA